VEHYIFLFEGAEHIFCFIIINDEGTLMVARDSNPKLETFNIFLPLLLLLPPKLFLSGRHPTKTFFYLPLLNSWIKFIQKSKECSKINCY